MESKLITSECKRYICPCKIILKKAAIRAQFLPPTKQPIDLVRLFVNPLCTHLSTCAVQLLQHSLLLKDGPHISPI